MPERSCLLARKCCFMYSLHSACFNSMRRSNWLAGAVNLGKMPPRGVQVMDSGLSGSIVGCNQLCRSFSSRWVKAACIVAVGGLLPIETIVNPAGVPVVLLIPIAYSTSGHKFRSAQHALAWSSLSGLLYLSPHSGIEGEQVLWRETFRDPARPSQVSSSRFKGTRGVTHNTSAIRSPWALVMAADGEALSR